MTNVKETSDFKKVQDELFSSTRKVWLASLGVLATVEEEGQHLFGELVERGEKIEARGKKSWTKTRKELESTTDEISGKLDQNISEVLQRMGVPSRNQVEQLTDRVEELTGQVERLSSTKKKAPAKTAARKTAVKTKAA